MGTRQDRDLTYRNDSTRGRDCAHGARGLSEGVTEHIREGYLVLRNKRKNQLQSDCN